jgi:hypothetical protein
MLESTTKELRLSEAQSAQIASYPDQRSNCFVSSGIVFRPTTRTKDRIPPTEIFVGL